MRYTGEELLKKVEEYFERTPQHEQTRAGMCVYLGITMSTYYKYKHGEYNGEDPKLQEAIEWACTRMEAKYELDLSKKNNPSGPIFALKQYGWKDNQDVEVKGTGAIEIITNIPRPKEE